MSRKDVPVRRFTRRIRLDASCLCLLAALVPAAPASAELAISQLVVDFKPGSSRTMDIEIYNDSTERSFVSIEPREVIGAGTNAEQRYISPDPEKLGLLVSPARLVLDPRQRRTLRMAVIGSVNDRERVYRVTVKPVTGDVTSSQTGLKLLVGYDLLVLVRPNVIKAGVNVARAGRNLTLTNNGNSSIELADGKQCDGNGENCQALPSKRLYAGASWEQSLPQSTAGEYRMRSADSWSIVKF